MVSSKIINVITTIPSGLEQCSLLGFRESICTQKLGEFPIVSNGKSKNKLVCAQQKRCFADENQPNGDKGLESFNTFLFDLFCRVIAESITS